MNTTWIRYPHTVELYTKTTSTNAAGQRKPTYSLENTVPCFYIPISSRDRQGPTYENINRDQLYIPPVDSAGNPIVIYYGMRLKNIRDREGNVIRGDAEVTGATSDSEAYDIHSLIKHTGWAGKVRFYQLIVMTSVEP